MKDLKKIMIAIPCLLRGGTEMQTLLLSRALVELGYEVDICCYFESDEQVVGEFKIVGVRIHLLGFQRFMGTVALIRTLRKIIKEASPDVVHIQYMTPGLLPIIAARLARAPLVLATVHYPGTPHGFYPLLLLRLGAMLSDCFTCVSEAAEKSWFGNSYLLDPLHQATNLRRKHLTIPNSIDIEAVDKALSLKSLKLKEIEENLKGKLVIGTVARLSFEKGIDILVRAFAELHKKILHTHLLIVGEGNQIMKLQALSRQLGVNDSIIWTGKLSWQDAIGCLNLMDVVSLPSRFEGFGLTAVEAMACGKPVVASRVDGLADVVKDGVTGILVQAEDASILSSTLASLLEDKEKRKKMGIWARKNVEKEYDYPIFKVRVEALYKRLL